ncbi:GTP-binding protein [Kytococcus sp. Marseille-QA3725]
MTASNRPGADGRLPVVVLGGTDRADLAAASMAVGCDLPDAVVLRIELDADAGTVRRVLHDATGLVEDTTEPLEHACHSCAAREALVPTLLTCAELGRWSAAVVELPLGGELLPVGSALGTDVVDDRVPELLDLRAVVAVVDPEGLLDRITVGLEEPAVAEASAAAVKQVEYADVLVLAGEGGEAQEADLTLLHHLAHAGATVVSSASALQAEELLAVQHDPEVAHRRCDPRDRRPTGAPDAHGIVTVVLESWRPLHPHRLMEAMEPMVLTSLRTRGAFWLPSRPDSALVWDECCGHLCLGDCGDWGGARRTRLVVTGLAEELPEFQRRFEEALMTDAEMVGAAQRWVGRPDGFEEWAGAA